MSKKSIFSNPAFSEKAAASKAEKSVGFNLVTQVKPNAFHSVFDTQSHALTPKEETDIEKLLVENRIPETVLEEQVPQDIIIIKETTKEIRAIGNQGAFLIGERVARARDILKRYKKDTFGSWLETTFGNRKTGYNFLAYYDLWRDLPNELVKKKYRLMPRRAAYILASRTVGLKDKVTFIDKFFDLKSNKLILEIRKWFPSSSPSKREPVLLSQLRDLIEKLSEEAEDFTKEELKDLKVLRKEIGKVTMKYLASPKPKAISLKGANSKDWSKLIEQAEFNGERFIIKCGTATAAIIPLEDLELLEKENL